MNILKIQHNVKLLYNEQGHLGSSEAEFSSIRDILFREAFLRSVRSSAVHDKMFLVSIIHKNRGTLKAVNGQRRNV